MVFIPKLNWVNSPSTATPITAAELIRLENGIVEGVRDASISQKGNVELATGTEMTTGTDTLRVPPVDVVKNYVTTAINDSTDNSILAFEEILNVVAPVATYDVNGQLLTPGPEHGDIAQFDADLSKYVVKPLEFGTLPLDDRYALSGYTPPWFVPIYLVDVDGEVVPDSFPTDGVIIDTTVLNQPLIESVNTVPAATGTIQLPSVDVATINDFTLSGNVTLAFPQAVPGSKLVIRIRQGATGRTVTFPSGITWPGADPSVPSLPSTTANTQARYIFVSDAGSGWTCVDFVQYAASGGPAPKANPTIRGSFGANAGPTANNLTTIDATLPGTIAAGDIGYAVVSHNDVASNTLTPPTGWTIIDGPITTGSSLSPFLVWLIRKVMVGSEDGATITCGFTSPGRPTVSGLVVAGGTTTGEVRAQLNDTTADLILDTPPITPSADQSLLVHLVAVRLNSSATVPTMAPVAGYVERNENNEGRTSSVNFGGYVETRALSGQGNLQQSAAENQNAYSVNSTDGAWLIAVPPA